MLMKITHKHCSLTTMEVLNSGFSSMDVDTSGDIMYGGFPIDFYYDLNLFYF